MSWHSLAKLHTKFANGVDNGIICWLESDTLNVDCTGCSGCRDEGFLLAVVLRLIFDAGYHSKIRWEKMVLYGWPQ